MCLMKINIFVRRKSSPVKLHRKNWKGCSHKAAVSHVIDVFTHRVLPYHGLSIIKREKDVRKIRVGWFPHLNSINIYS